MVSKLTKNPENKRTGMAVTGPTNVATWRGNKHKCDVTQLFVMSQSGVCDVMQLSVMSHSCL